MELMTQIVLFEKVVRFDSTTSAEFVFWKVLCPILSHLVVVWVQESSFCDHLLLPSWQTVGSRMIDAHFTHFSAWSSWRILGLRHCSPSRILSSYHLVLIQNCWFNSIAQFEVLLTARVVDVLSCGRILWLLFWVILSLQIKTYWLILPQDYVLDMMLLGGRNVWIGSNHLTLLLQLLLLSRLKFTHGWLMLQQGVLWRDRSANTAYLVLLLPSWDGTLLAMTLRIDPHIVILIWFVSWGTVSSVTSRCFVGWMGQRWRTVVEISHVRVNTVLIIKQILASTEAWSTSSRDRSEPLRKLLFTYLAHFW